jgi:hypothetical protein
LLFCTLQIVNAGFPDTVLLALGSQQGGSAMDAEIDSQSGFGRFWFRVTACHLVTYFIAGLIAYSVFQYKGLFESEALSSYMRPVSSKWVAAGPAFQVIRGLILAAVLYPFRAVLLSGQAGWLKLAGLLVGLSVLSSAGPAPGSVEGFIYTRLSWLQHIRGLPEVIAQNLALAGLLAAWYHSPRRSWGIVMGTLTAVGILFSLAALFLPRAGAYQ